MSDAQMPGGDRSGIVVEYLVRGRSTWGTRLSANGSADEWSETDGWQPLVRVDADDLAGFLELAGSGGFLGLPATVQANPPVEDASEISWEIEVAGRRHRVVAREASHARNPVLVELDAELQRIVGEALNRDADDAEGAEVAEGADTAAGPDTAAGHAPRDAASGHDPAEGGDAASGHDPAEGGDARA